MRQVRQVLVASLRLAGAVVLTLPAVACSHGRTASSFRPARTTAGARMRTSARRPTPTPTPTARLRADVIPSVGPLFGAGRATHGCTAAVVHTPPGDVIMTAAHCVSGSGAGMVFAPGYDDGGVPFGTWLVTRAYVPRAWTTSHDPQADYAYLVVNGGPANQSTLPIEAVVGGNVLGHAPARGQRVTLVGYVAGRGGRAVVCSGVVYRTTGYPTVDCGGFAAGTSGGPWLARYDATTRTGVITAVIGGLDHGGCSADTSYSSTFTATATALLSRASAGAPADTVPAPEPSGC